MRRTLALSALTLLLVAAPARAQNLGLWIEPYAGAGPHEMGELNDDIAVLNDLLRGSGASMPELNAGFGGGGLAALIVAPGLSLGIGYERLFASTEVSVAGSRIGYDLPANLVQVIGRWEFAAATQRNAYFEFGIGAITSSGHLEWTLPDLGSGDGDFDGNGVSYQGVVGGQVWLTRAVAVSLALGYRTAVIGDIELEGVPYTGWADNITDYEFDYSGPLVRLGLTLRAPR